MNKVTIIGSINLDRTIRVEQMPKPGETMHTLEIFSSGGGKGANQAVAAQRLGAQTFFIGGVGNDESGQMMRELLVMNFLKKRLKNLTRMQCLPHTTKMITQKLFYIALLKVRVLLV